MENNRFDLDNQLFCPQPDDIDFFNELSEKIIGEASKVASLVEQEILSKEFLSPSRQTNINTHEANSTIISEFNNLGNKANSSLGKRCRSYMDILSEETYLSSMKSSIYFQRPVSDWSQFLHNYSNELELYTDWSDYYTPNHNLKSSIKNDINNNIKYNPNNEVEILVPPVPVHIEHPASFGIQNRCNTETKADFSIIHPACYSSAIVTEQIRINKMDEDDELTVSYNQMISQLKEDMEFCCNKFHSLNDIYLNGNRINKIKTRRKHLETVLNQLYLENEPKTSERNTYIAEKRKKGNTNQYSRTFLNNSGMSRYFLVCLL